MTWEEKLQACQALGEVSLKMRKPGDWYVSQNIEVKSGGVLHSVYGNGSTPKKAVENHWEKLTVLKSSQYIVLNFCDDNRRAVKWNGFMWEEIEENK